MAATPKGVGITRTPGNGNMPKGPVKSPARGEGYHNGGSQTPPKR